MEQLPRLECLTERHRSLLSPVLREVADALAGAIKNDGAL
jgi:hypothetical protein